MKFRTTGGYDPWFGPAPQYGAPIETRPRTIALLGADTPGLRPVFSVEPGTRVAAGDTLFIDKKRPELRFTAPGAGTVAEIHRGPRRSFDRLVLSMDGDDKKQFGIPTPLDRTALCALMVEAGLWTGLTARPFGHIPAPDTQPAALFITAIDTRPLAPDPAEIIAAHVSYFTRGLAAIRLLTSGKTYLCHRHGAELPHVDAITEAGFTGPHPAGLAGTHIHHLHPLGGAETVWSIDYQDIIALGHLLETGTIWQRRVIGLAGNGLTSPILIETVPGADLHDLCRDRLEPGPVRLLSGSPLDGRITRYLAKGHRQVSALRHNRVPERANWARHVHDWLSRGSGAVIPNRLHDRAAPPGMLAIPFLRAISVGDAETAKRLGALEFIEEDMALLTHADGGHTDYGLMLRRVLNALEAAR